MHYPKHRIPALVAALPMTPAAALIEHARDTAAACLQIAETAGPQQAALFFKGDAESCARVLLDQGVDLEGPTGVAATLLAWGHAVEGEIARLKRVNRH
jgi:hypothetical protein